MPYIREGGNARKHSFAFVTVQWRTLKQTSCAGLGTLRTWHRSEAPAEAENLHGTKTVLLAIKDRMGSHFSMGASGSVGAGDGLCAAAVAPAAAAAAVVVVIAVAAAAAVGGGGRGGGGVGVGGGSSSCSLGELCGVLGGDHICGGCRLASYRKGLTAEHGYRYYRHSVFSALWTECSSISSLFVCARVRIPKTSNHISTNTKNTQKEILEGKLVLVVVNVLTCRRNPGNSMSIAWARVTELKHVKPVHSRT